MDSIKNNNKSQTTQCKSGIERRSFLKTSSLIFAGALIFPREIYSKNSIGGSKLPISAADIVWPVRPLLKEKYENSMEAKMFAKQIYESMLVDDMEKEDLWTASSTVQIEYTKERSKSGTQSLRFRMKQPAVGTIKFGAPSMNGSIKIKFDQEQDWSKFNRISFWCFVHPTKSNLHCLSLSFICKDAPYGPNDPLSIHITAGIKAGEWNYVVWEIPELQRDKIIEFSISRPYMGRTHKGWDEDIIYDFDQLQLERVDPKPYEGWSVAVDNIAYNHVGYMASAEKLAVASGFDAMNFQLLDAVTDQVVAVFPSKEVVNIRGQFNLLDFSSFTKSGLYKLRFNNIITRPFSISDDVWNGTIDKLMNFFYGDRCGFEIVGFHESCHHDVTATFEGIQKTMNGGWHDAGNLTQGAYRTDICAFSMLKLYERLNERKLNTEMQTRVLEEARWGYEWSLKTHFGNGNRVTMAMSSPYTDNQVGTADDVSCRVGKIPFENFCGAATLAYAAKIFQSIDADFSAQLLEAAKGDFKSAIDARQQPPVFNRPLRIHQANWSDELGYGTLAAIELYKATHEQQYADEAFRLGKLLMGMQEQRFVDSIPVTGYYYEDVDHKRIVHDTHSSFQEAASLAFSGLCEMFPEHPDWMNWYAAVLLQSEFLFCEGSKITEPYGLLPAAVWRRSELEEWKVVFGKAPLFAPGFEGIHPESTTEKDVAFKDACDKMFNEAVHLAPDIRLRAFPLINDALGHGNINIHLAQTTALAAAAELRSDNRSDVLVARQMQWLFGGNPFSQTLMYGEGYDYQRLIATGIIDLVGVMPLGFDGNHGDAPRWTHGSFYAPKDLWVVTSGRTIMSLSHVAVPALVKGTASAGATFFETRSGKKRKVKPGTFEINLASGDYEIKYGKELKKMTIVSSGKYDLSLNPQNALELELAVLNSKENTVQVNLKLFGTGKHHLDFRLFNCLTDNTSLEVTLKAGQEQNLTCILTVINKEIPWILIVLPDKLMSHKRELFGTVLKINETALKV